MKQKGLLLVLILLLVSSGLWAQDISIKGKVTDKADNSPIIGVTVGIKGKPIGTMTDAAGRYIIKAKPSDVLIFSFVGMDPQEIPVGKNTVIDVALSSNSRKIDEVVVVAYGTVKKSDLTGSVGTIKSDALLKGGPASINQGLQGKMAGVIVNQNDGAPGAGVSIQIRGANSFSTSSQPLYVVDGIPYDAASTPSGGSGNSGNNQTSNPLSLINPNDIQSIEVLKDASATALYGSRGANGVIMITTKRGEVGTDKIEFSANFGISKIANKVDVLDASTYARYINEETVNSKFYENTPYTTLPYSGTWSYSYDSNGNMIQNSGKYNPKPEDFQHPGKYTDKYGNSSSVKGADWQDLIYQTGKSSEYNLSISGGTDKGWYSISGNYLEQEGTIKNSDFNRYSIRSNIGRKPFKWLEVGLNTNFSQSKTNFAKTSANDYGVIRSALIFPTTFNPDQEATAGDQLNWLAANPYIYVQTAKDRVTSGNAFNSSYAEIKFTDYLKFRQNLGLGYSKNDRGTYYGSHTQEGKSPTNGLASQSDSWYTSRTSESLLSFDKVFAGDHTVGAMIGFSTEFSEYGGKVASSQNFPTDITEEYDLSQGLTQNKTTSSRGRNTLLSYLARINYSYKGKYLFTASVRRDGSSKFSDKNKYATFPSAAFAWKASEESFIKNLNVFSNLKVRASYGQTGNQGISSYMTRRYLGTSNYPVGGSLNSGFSEVDWRGPTNPNLKWETTEQYNAGIDMGFFSNRLNITVDYYHKKTTDLLQNVKIPLSTGFGNMMTNFGWVTNEGWEFTGKFYAFTGSSFKWDIDANLSFNKNRIGGLPSDQFANALWYKADEVFIQRNGMPIGAIYGYIEDGYYDNEAEVRADPKYATSSADVVKSKIGEIKYRVDKNGKPIRTIIGDTNPDFILGITNNLSYKDFTLSFFIQGVFGNDIFNGNLMDVKMANIGNIPVDAYNSRWTPENRENAKWPKAVAGYNREWLLSDRYVEDGSYVRLKNVNLGYTFHPKFKGVQSINVYASATNLLTFTDYSWFDPDVNAFGGDASRRGVDIYSYPSSRTFSLGFRFTF
jgi:TonB-linked SusC/RagA family outer membrane protein